MDVNDSDSGDTGESIDITVGNDNIHNGTVSSLTVNDRGPKTGAGLRAEIDKAYWRHGLIYSVIIY